MGSDEKKSTSTTGSSSAKVRAAVDKLAGGLTSLYTPGKSSYVAPSSTTTDGWAASLGAAGNPNFASGIAGALQSFGNRAAGNEIGMNDPGYATLRNKLRDDTLQDVNSMFTTSGRFGSGSHVGSASEGLANALAGLDYKQYSDSLARQSEAANMLPQLFAAGQLPSSIQQSVGASMDADARAKEAGPWDYLNRATGALTGTAGAAGTTTTTKEPTAPLWQQLIGAGLSIF